MIQAPRISTPRTGRGRLSSIRIVAVAAIGFGALAAGCITPSDPRDSSTIHARPETASHF